jgi:hypothetical protein
VISGVGVRAPVSGGQRTFYQADVLRQFEPLLTPHFDCRVEPYLEEELLGRPTFEIVGRQP